MEKRWGLPFGAKASFVRDPEVGNVVESVLPQTPLPHEVARVLILYLAGLAAEGDGEALPRELPDGDKGAPTAEARDKADAAKNDIRRGYGADGGDGVVLAGARGKAGAASFLWRTRIGQQVRAGRGVHGGPGVHDEIDGAVLGAFRRWFGIATSRMSPFCSALNITAMNRLSVPCRLSDWG